MTDWVAFRLSAFTWRVLNPLAVPGVPALAVAGSATRTRPNMVVVKTVRLIRCPIDLALPLFVTLNLPCSRDHRFRRTFSLSYRICGCASREEGIRQRNARTLSFRQIWAPEPS